MKAMKYKGYFAKVDFDAEDRLFVGHVIGIRDVVGFHGELCLLKTPSDHKYQMITDMSVYLNC